MDHKIPRINLSRCTTRDFLRAFEEAGVLVLEGGCDPERIRDLHHFAQVAFTEREHLRSQPFDRAQGVGYTPPGGERTIESGPIHLRHFFDYRAGAVTMSTRETEEIAFRKFYKTLVDNTRSILRNLDCIAPWSSLLEEGTFVLRIAEALNDKPEPWREIFPPHRDFGLFTIFVGGAYAGLDMEIGGKWIPVNPGAGDYLIAPGKIFEQYHPKTKVVRHRVMGTSARRISLTLFVDPGPEVVLPKSNERVADYFGRLYERVREPVA